MEISVKLGYWEWITALNFLVDCAEDSERHELVREQAQKLHDDIKAQMIAAQALTIPAEHVSGACNCYTDFNQNASDYMAGRYAFNG